MESEDNLQVPQDHGPVPESLSNLQHALSDEFLLFRIPLEKSFRNYDGSPVLFSYVTLPTIKVQNLRQKKLWLR